MWRSGVEIGGENRMSVLTGEEKTENKRERQRERERARDRSRERKMDRESLYCFFLLKRLKRFSLSFSLSFSRLPGLDSVVRVTVAGSV